MQKIGELERLGENGRDVMVLGLDAPGFRDLSTDRKIFAYYLYRAAIAGDAVMYYQSHRYAFEIKRLLEQIYTHATGIPDDLKSALGDYLKYVWIHHGNYHHSTGAKFVPRALSPDGLLRAARIAHENGAMIAAGPGEAIEQKLQRLRPVIFDAECEPVQSARSADMDVVANSAVNLWDRGITQADIDALPSEWKHKINVRFARRDGTVVPEPYRIGGLYGRELGTISHFLRLALPQAEREGQARSIEHLLEYFNTGDEEAFRAHSIDWLSSNPTIDYINGFIEQYMDPRGVIGSYEANVTYAADNRIVDAIADNALYFEARMPWPDRFKRSRVTAPVAQVVNVLLGTGDAGPVSPAAYNLPNYNDIRRDHGSKNVILENVENTSSQDLLETVADAFYLPEYRDNVIKYFRTKVRPLEVYLHEIIGHGSGQPASSLTADPRTLLGRVYSALEECRSDLVALYFMADPKLVEIGAFDADEQQTVVETAYITYTQGWLARLDRVELLEVREAHNKGHHLILMYLLENGGDGARDFGLEVIRQDGDFYVRLKDAGRMRHGLGDLLGKLQVLKSTGDAEGAAALFDRFGTQVNPEWKANIAARAEKLNLPRLKAFVFPRLVPRIENGAVTDVHAVCDEDLTTQQLRFSRLHNVTDLAADGPRSGG